MLQDLLTQAKVAQDEVRLEDALEICNRLVDGARAAGHKALEAAGLQRRGVTYDLMDRSEEAEKEVRAAMAINQKLGAEGAPSLRQDLYTLGVIFMGRGDVENASAQLIESAKLADELGDFESGARARFNVAILKGESGDPEGASQILELISFGGPGPRTFAGLQANGLLIRWHAEEGNFDRVSGLVAENAFAVGYFASKHEKGEIRREDLTEVLTSVINMQIEAGTLMARGGQKKDATVVFDGLEHLLDEMSLKDSLSEVKKLRKELNV